MSETLYAGIGEICDRAMQHACADGAALAVLSQSAQNRELIYASDSVAQRLDELQYTIGEGPCFDAYLDDSPQFYPELASTVSPSRWPTFAADATDLGAHALFAFPIPDGQQPLGVLELYRRSMGSLDTVQCAAVKGCAQMIADRLLSNWKDYVSRFGDVTHALNAVAASHDARVAEPANPFTRTQIHVAGGMIAVQLGVSADEGVDRLRSYAFATGRRLSSVAADVIARRLSLHH